MSNPLSADLDHVLAHTQGLWDALRGQRLFITGGTGFFGCWLLESFIWANERLDLGAQAVALTRNPVAFREKAPHLATHPTVSLLAGDVRDFEFPDGEFSHIIHAATEAVPRLTKGDPLLALDTIVDGTRHALEFSRHCGAQGFLLTSSGAIYGPQPPHLANIPEDFGGAPSAASSASAYGEGKRLAELLCTIYHERHGVAARTARCFAFVGPYLPLGAHFAVGNFIRDGLAGGPIRVNGDGTPYRSYLYAADLAIWLWTVLLQGEAGRAYNVGAEHALSIRDLADVVARQFDPAPEVRVARQAAPGEPATRYVPDTARARQELGLEAWVGLEDALTRWVAACSSQERSGSW